MAKVENKKSWIEVEVKAVDATDEFPNGSFECILSTADLDRDGEVVEYGCFNPLPDYLPAIVDHDAQAKNVVGWGVPTYENGVLMIRGPFDADEFSQIIRGKLVSGSIRKMSIGFMNAKRERKDGVPHVVSAEALEASFVVIPANRGADVVSAKAYANVEPPAGSFEEVQEDVSEALETYYGEDAYVCLIATFVDHVVYAVRHWPEQTQDGTYSMSFTLDANGVDGATFSSDPVSVEITQVISEKAAKRWATKAAEFAAASTKSADVIDEISAVEAELLEMELDADMEDIDGATDQFDDDTSDDDFDAIVAELNSELDSFDDLDDVQETA